MANLARSSASFRRTLVRALRDEGMRLLSIRRVLQVSRQRVGALLRQRPEELPDER
jgi:hypothetical protein